MSISNLAFVHPDARLGEGVVVEPFAYIAGDVVIGERTWIGPHAVILDGATIGKDCKIHSAAVVAGIPQDLKFKGEKTTLVMGDRTTVRECVTLNRGTAARGETTIGNDCLIMAYAHVGHDCRVGNNVILVNGVSLAGEVEIDDWAILGGHSAVHQFSKVGAHAMVSGGSMIFKDVPPFTKAAHTPISYVGINSVGLRRRGFTNEQMTDIQAMCRILFQSGFSYAHGCEKVGQELPQSKERDMMLDFIRSSKRGIFKPYQSVMKDVETD